MRHISRIALLGILPSVALASGVLDVLIGGSILPLTSSASPTSLSYTAPGATLTTGSTTCAGHGGVVPYGFGWSWGTGGSGITINSASSATTSFTVSSAAVNTTYSGTAQCLVTDARPATAPYSDVSVSLTRIPLLPPSLGTASLVAGSNANFTGYSQTLAIGSLSPSTDYNGNFVYTIECQPAVDLLYLVVSQPSSNSTYVTGLNINGTTYLTSAATYTYNSTLGQWEWGATPCPMTSGNTYPVYYY